MGKGFEPPQMRSTHSKDTCEEVLMCRQRTANENISEMQLPTHDMTEIWTPNHDQRWRRADPGGTFVPCSWRLWQCSHFGSTV